MKCFLYALRGIAETIKSERNMRIHLCFAFYVTAAGFVCKIGRAEWLAVLLCIGLVTALECVNTALERLCDTVHPEKSSGIRFAKDAAAGAVLCAAVLSAAVGGVIFFNSAAVKVTLDFFGSYPIPATILILTLIPAVLFVRGTDKV